MIDVRSRRAAGAAVVVLTLGIVVAALLLSDPSRRDTRVVLLGIGEELVLDPSGGNRLRLVTVTTEADGHHTLFLESSPLGASATPVRLTSREPLLLAHHSLRLLSVRPDEARGAAVQLQWIPRNSDAPRPLFSVGEEVVRLPVSGHSLEIRVIGDVPPPGRGPLDIEVAGLPEGPTRVRLAWSGTAPVGSLAELRWIGTRERLLARIEVR
ncbi:MAG: hypothetical protein SGI90_13480 [Candidatus Eisenbacteria bacterium]|nr:hypothetical protein [Candidatus Eisenbacteria bacterium]